MKAGDFKIRGRDKCEQWHTVRNCKGQLLAFSINYLTNKYPAISVRPDDRVIFTESMAKHFRCEINFERLTKIEKKKKKEKQKKYRGF